MKLLPFGNYSVGHIITYEKSLVYSIFPTEIECLAVRNMGSSPVFCYHGAILVDFDFRKVRIEHEEMDHTRNLFNSPDTGICIQT